MIYGNNLVFGYGDISISAIPSQQAIVFQELKTYCKVGEAINLENVEIGENRIEIKLTYELYKEFLNHLDEALKEAIPEFTFCDWVFSFYKNIPKSITICKKKAMEAMSLYLNCTAC